MGVIQDFLISLWDYRRYPELLKNSKRRVFAFAALLIFVFWLMTVAVPYAAFQLKTGGVSSVIREYVPEFSLSNGKLDVPGGYHFTSGSLYVDVNTDPGHLLDPEDRQIRTRMALSDAVVLADQEKIIYGAGAAGTGATSGPRVQYFSDFGDLTFTKEDLIRESPQIEHMYRLFGGMLYFYHLAMFFLGCLVIAVFGQIFSGFTRTPVTYWQVYELSVYTRSVPLLIKGVLGMAGLVPAELPALSLLFSLFVLSRVFRHIDREQAAAGEPHLPGFDFEEFRRQMELRGAELPHGGPGRQDFETGKTSEEISGEEGTAEQGPEEEAAAGRNPEKEETAQQKAKPDLLLPRASEKKDIRPSDGWSFGVFSKDTAPDEFPGKEPEKQESSDEEQE